MGAFKNSQLRLHSPIKLMLISLGVTLCYSLLFGPTSYAKITQENLNQFSMNDFLKQTIKDYSSIKNKNLDDDLQSQSLFRRVQVFHESETASAMSPIEKTGTLGLRFSPQFAQSYAIKEMKEKLKHQINVEDQLFFSEKIRELYALLLNIHYLNSQTNLFDKAKLLNDKTDQALLYLLKKNRLDPKVNLKLQSEISRLNILFSENEIEENRMQNLLHSLGGFNVHQISFSDLITIDELKKRFSEKKNKCAKKEAISIHHLQSQIDLLSYEYQVEQAKDKEWLESFDFSVKRDKGEHIIAMKVNVNLPFLTAKSPLDSLKKMKTLREIETLKLEKKSKNFGLATQERELSVLLATYDANKKNSMSLSYEEIQTLLSKYGSQDLSSILELQKNWFESQVRDLNLEFKIRTAYVNYLGECSLFIENPSVNHLSISDKVVFN